MLVKIAEPCVVKGGRASVKAHKISELLHFRLGQDDVEEVIRRRYLWHFPDCPFCGHRRLIRPEFSEGKYLEPFVCPNCGEQIPEDIIRLREKYFDYRYKMNLKYHNQTNAREWAERRVESDKEALHRLTLKELDDIKKYERKTNRRLKGLLKPLQIAHRLGRKIDDLYYDLKIRDELYNEIKGRWKRGKISEGIFNTFLDDLKKLKKLNRLKPKTYSGYWSLWKKYYILRKATQGNESNTPLTLDYIREARQKIEECLTILKNEPS